MATPIFTEKSAEHVNRSESASSAALADLDLPCAPEFLSLPPQTTTDTVLELSISYLPKLIARPEYWRERAANRCPAEFDLEHPERVVATYPAALLNELFTR